MTEFVKRLGLTIGYVLGFLVMMIIFITFVILLSNENVILLFIIKYIVGIPVMILFATVFIAFLYWLFIEPFRMKKNNKEES